MFSDAQDIQGLFSTFGGGVTFYPGDTVTFKLHNGTEISDKFFAIYYDQGPSGPLETGGDFYNLFVLGFYPDSYDPDLIDNNTINITSVSTSSIEAPASSTVSAISPTSTDTSDTMCEETWDNEAYPNCPDVAQQDLGGDGYISG
jgi:hypothetical protein